MSQIKVKVGEYNFNEAGETLDSTYALASMVYHENYNTKTYENDIAILKLERPVTFSRSTDGHGFEYWPHIFTQAFQKRAFLN